MGCVGPLSAPCNRWLGAVFATALAGATIGVTEAIYIAIRTRSGDSVDAIWWSVFAYGIFLLLLLPVGALALPALPYRYPVPCFVARSLPWHFGTSVFFGVVIVGRWRFYEDVIGNIPHSPIDKTLVWAGSLLAAAVLGGLAYWAVSQRRGKWSIIALSVATIAVTLVSVSRHERREASLAVVGEGNPSVAPDGDLPNILLIVADTLRADVLTPYNESARPNTPALARLAEDSVVFRSHFAQSSWTKPSFGTLLTGLHPRSHGAVSQVAILPDGVTTLAELLGAYGYLTMGFSNANANNSRKMNFSQGFAHWEDLQPSHFYLGAPRAATQLVLYRRLIDQLGKLVLLDVRQYYQPAETVTGRTLEWLDDVYSKSGSPLFAMIHYMDAHDPYMNGKLRGPGYANELLHNRDKSRIRDQMVAAYEGDVEYLDCHFGALLEGLRERRLYDDSLIVFTSDHGEEFSEHGGWFHGDSIYDEVVAVPLFIKLPGVDKGTEYTGLSSHIDIVPTLLHAVGLPVPEVMPGRILMDGAGTGRTEKATTVFLETEARAHVLGVRSTSAKAIWNIKPDGAVASFELYDLREDPEERQDISSVKPTLLERFEDIVAEAVAESDAVAVRRASSKQTWELQQQLEALGYLH